MNLTIFPALLVLLVALLETAAWLGDLPVARPGAARIAFTLVEMALLAALLWNGWRIRAHVQAQADATPLARSTATLVFASLAVCIGGDLVNRNFGGGYFAYDEVVEFSFLADSVWFFFPGYLLFIVAAWRATTGRVSTALRAGTLALAAVAGVFTFRDLVLPGTADYVRVMTGAYSVLISLMVPVALWILLAFGRAGWPVALGAVLATLADALIGHFWLFGAGWYPGVAYLNLVVYFLSQALLQQFPLRVLDVSRRAA